MAKLNTYVALLRGINVGGNTIISMVKLKECFEKLGYSNVKTYINSGNVIFASSAQDSAKLEAQIAKAIKSTFSFEIKIVVRSKEQIDNLIKVIPKKWYENNDYRYNVIFLTRTIDSPDIVKGLEPKPDIENVSYYPGTLLWAAKTSDLTKSNMLKIIKSAVYKEMTIRNLNTTKKIHQLMQELDS